MNVGSKPCGLIFLKYDVSQLTPELYPIQPAIYHSPVAAGPLSAEFPFFQFLGLRLNSIS